MIKGVMRKKDGRVVEAWEVSTPYTLQDGEEFCSRKEVREYEKEALAKQSAKKSAENQPFKQHPFILNEDVLPQDIDHAVGIIKLDNQERRYYGTMLVEQKEQPKKKGGTYITQERVPAIILDNGELYSETYQPAAKFTFNSVMGIKTREWSLRSIREYRAKMYSEETVTPKAVYHLFKKTYDEYLVFEEEAIYAFNALWDCITYFPDLVDTFLIIKHEGQSGSAKSKGATASARQSFHGRSFLCPTPASFFRYRNNNRSMLAIEEAERLFADKQNRDDAQILEYLNGSYEKGHPVPRQNDKDLNVTEEFDAAGFTRICAINPLQGALRKRSITINMVAARKGDERAAKETPNRESEFFQIRRDRAHIMGLLYWKKYREALRSVKNDYGVANREWALIKPLLAFAQLFDNDLKQMVGRWLAKQFDIRDEPLSEESWDFWLIKTTIQRFAYFDKESCFVASKDIRDAWNASLGKDFSTKKTTTDLNKLGLGRFNGHNPAKTERGYSATFWEVADILLRNDKITLEKMLIYVSEVSMCPITTEKVRKWYTDTFGHKDTFSGHMDGQDTFLGVRDKKNNCVLSYETKLEKCRKLLKKNGSMSVLDLQRMNPSYDDAFFAKAKEQGVIFEKKPGEVVVLE